MISIRAFRSNPDFAELFAHVHVICWPILWWKLNALYSWWRRAGIPEVLYTVNAWGCISVRYAGTAADPSLHRPVERTFRDLSDQ